jgi:hypothetical protein
MSRATHATPHALDETTRYSRLSPREQVIIARITNASSSTARALPREIFRTLARALRGPRR